MTNPYHRSLLDKFALSRLAYLMGRYIPQLDFYPIPAGLILRELSTYENVIEVGCGTGRVLTRLRFLDKGRILRRTNFMGGDVWKPSLLQSKNIYNHVIQCSAQNLPLRKLPSCCILAVDLIEHLRKKEAIKAFNEFGRLGDVLLVTPVGSNPKKQLEDDNPFQQHHSSWNPGDFKRKGYTVRGINGIRVIRREKCQFVLRGFIALPFQVLLTIFSQVFVYRLPRAAYHMMCVKHSCY